MISPCLLSNTVAKLLAFEIIITSSILHFSNGTVPGGNSTEYVPAVHSCAPSLNDILRLMGCYRRVKFGMARTRGDCMSLSPPSPVVFALLRISRYLIEVHADP